MGNNDFLESKPNLYNVGDHTESHSGGLTGRFLHITDLHPDSHYKLGSTTDSACHRGKGPSGYYGLAGSDCDAPFSLINETFRWVDENLRDKIDFVVWTGDSARHDNDEKIPRTVAEIASLNKFVARKFVDVFDKQRRRSPSIPVVPTIGNNDIMPHNILKAGPNEWTKKFLDIWKKFIPEEQRHTFIQGGWFTSEVIPGNLAVISLNTMYFYDSNHAVDGCESPSEPGYEQMDWLRVQLQLLRERKMKAILIGHVPPARSGSKRNWEESCWQKYALWKYQYRDIIVGSLYGHMNIDHFMMQDSHKIKIVDLNVDNAFSDDDEESSKELSVSSQSTYLASLREQWSKLPSPPCDPLFNDDSIGDWSATDPTTDDGNHSPDAQNSKKKRRFLKKIGGPWAERYSVSLVAPSVVPNFYPTLRVVEYNITGLQSSAIWADTSVDLKWSRELHSRQVEDSNTESYMEHKPSLGEETDKDKKKNKDNKKKNPRFKVPRRPSSTAPPGPAYSNQPLTWLSYTQYYANITKINDKIANLGELSANEKGYGHDNAHYPLEFEVEYDTKVDDVYRLQDLTVRNFFRLASWIAKGDPEKKNMGSLSSSFCDYSDSPSTEQDQSLKENRRLDDDIYNGDDDDNDVHEQKKGGKKNKKKKNKNRVWIKFLERAFVGFLDANEIDDELDQ